MPECHRKGWFRFGLTLDSLSNYTLVGSLNLHALQKTQSVRHRVSSFDPVQVPPELSSNRSR